MSKRTQQSPTAVLVSDGFIFPEQLSVKLNAVDIMREVFPEETHRATIIDVEGNVNIRVETDGESISRNSEDPYFNDLPDLRDYGFNPTIWPEYNSFQIANSKLEAIEERLKAKDLSDAEKAILKPQQQAAAVDLQKASDEYLEMVKKWKERYSILYKQDFTVAAKTMENRWKAELLQLRLIALND